MSRARGSSFVLRGKDAMAFFNAASAQADAAAIRRVFRVLAALSGARW